MGIAALLQTVVQMLPVVQTLVSIIDREKRSDIPEIVALAGEIIPNVQALVQKIELIRSQTEDEHAEVWATVRDDWNSAVAKWNASQS